MSEEVNRKLPARNTIVQLSTLIPSGAEHYNTFRHRHTDRQTTLWWQYL